MQGGLKRRRVEVHERDGAARSFAGGIRVSPEFHYFVNPDVSDLVSDVLRRNYCLLTGHRQSGKSTSIVCALAEASGSLNFLPVLFSRGVPDVLPDWSEDQMWKRLCKLLHLASPSHFPAVTDDKLYSSDDFVESFSVHSLKEPAVLVIDEADTLFRLSPECIGALLHNVRIMKAEPAQYRLRTVVLVGTDRVKDLIHCSRYQSVYSPFPHDRVLSSTRFTPADVEQLLMQFVEDYPVSAVPVRSMAESVMELTDGHKGLTGTCLAYMDQRKAYNLDKWNAMVANREVESHVFSLATYRRVMEAVREMKPRILKPFVESARLRYFVDEFDDAAEDLRPFIAGGVLIVDREGPYCYVRLSSPLLRMAILRRLVVKEFTLRKTPPSLLLQTEEDRVWVLQTVLELLDGSPLSCPEVWLHDEYFYQFAFMARLKAVLEQAYPSMRLKVSPQVRQLRVAATNSLLGNCSSFKTFGVVFGSSGPKGTHYVKALRYAAQHSAIVYLINITVDETFEELVPDSEDVVFVGVEFKKGVAAPRVKMIYKDRPVVELSLNLERWTGQVEYQF